MPTARPSPPSSPLLSGLGAVMLIGLSMVCLSACGSPAALGADSSLETGGSRQLVEVDQMGSIAEDGRGFRLTSPGHFEASLSSSFTAELTADGLRARNGSDEVVLRTISVDGVVGPSVGLELGGCTPVPGAMSSGSCRQVSVPVGEHTAWWISDQGRLQQGWTIWSGEAEVVVRLAAEVGRIASIDPDKGGASLIGTEGGRWRYDGLAAWDANGVDLETWMERGVDGLKIVVDTTDSSWPVVVDPLLRPIKWSEIKVTAAEAAPEDHLGESIAIAGDLDGDGYDDLVAGAPDQDGNGLDSGSAHVFYGSASGFDRAKDDMIVAFDAAPHDHFGEALSGVGDVDGDGFDDLVVGVRYDDDNGSGSGSAYVFYGSSTGIDSTRTDKLTPSDGVEVAYFGIAVSGAGDLDADGYADVVVGAHMDHDKGSRSGSAYVYYGSATGIDTASSDKITPSDGGQNVYFGAAVSDAGDLNADGYDDFVVGADHDHQSGGEESGSVYVYYGSSTGINHAREDIIRPFDGADYDNFGDEVSGAGDLDLDGYDDIVVGSRDDDDNGPESGSVYVYYGSSKGIRSGRSDKITPSDGASSDRFGDSISGAGDLDGDGYADIVVGAAYDDDNGSNSGSAYVFYGSSTGIDSTEFAKVTSSDGTESDYFGVAVSGAGDLNGDGHGEFVVGAPYDDDESSQSGSIYVYGRCVDEDGDGFCTSADCDDGDSATGDGTTWYADQDEDSYGDPDGAETVCSEEGPSGYVSNSDDCDDDRPDANPDAIEVCDSIDNDCDGTKDNDDAVDASSWYTDGDRDGYGDPNSSVLSCEQPNGYVASGEDCDDHKPLVHPGGVEVCDSVDNDCDGTIDNDDAVDAAIWYADADGDGYGDPDARSTACHQPEGTSGDASDCDDTDPDTWPGAREVEDDGIDQDCDGEDSEGGGCSGCASTSEPRSAAWLLVPFGVMVGRRRARELGNT